MTEKMKARMKERFPSTTKLTREMHDYLKEISRSSRLTSQDVGDFRQRVKKWEYSNAMIKIFRDAFGVEIPPTWQDFGPWMSKIVTCLRDAKEKSIL